MISDIIEAVFALLEKWALAYICKREAARKQSHAPITNQEELDDIANLPGA